MWWIVDTLWTRDWQVAGERRARGSTGDLARDRGSQSRPQRADGVWDAASATAWDVAGTQPESAQQRKRKNGDGPRRQRG